ncbi:MAG TPA: hypothetical protein VHT01_01925 [Candidatus Udaeobacter sp.]|nr:hypothetical protein [Candidatus Udaeobacter sp.]
MTPPIYHRTGRSPRQVELSPKPKEGNHVIAWTLSGSYSDTLKLVLRANMSFDEALKVASRDERFMATVYAMNSLLIQKGIYTTEEFESIFIEWVNKERRKKTRSVKASSQVLCEA